MTVAFVLDTSASMNQRCSNGLSLLDCAKSAVEAFMRARMRESAWHRTDRYLLVTCEEGPNSIKAVDKFPFAVFTRALKSIEAHDLTEIGAALQQLLDYLHLQRLANDTDKFGQGRNPCSIEPTIIILLTDGTELTSKAGILKSIVPSGPAPPGGELSAKPFRWDQRVFAIVLRLPSVTQQVLERSGPLPLNAPISGSQTALAMDTDISTFCESTGGKCFVATNVKILLQHIEFSARLSTGVIVSFDNMPIPGAAVPPSQVQAACQRKLLFIKANQPHQGHWPIPEAYWPDSSQQSPPSREPHPLITYRAVDSDPFIPPQFIYDKYDIESNPIVNFLMKSASGICWQVYIRNSKGPNYGYGDPFGYLRLYGNNLSLYVLPYNYPILWHLLDQAAKIPKVTGLPQWRQEMERYCNTIPCYYGPPLKTALRQWGLTAHCVPDSVEKSLLSGFVGSQLKRLKTQAKIEAEKLEKILPSNIPSGKPSERVFPLIVASTPASSPASHLFTTTSFSVRLSATGGEPSLTQKTFEVPVPSGPSSSSTSTRAGAGAGAPEIPRAAGDSLGSLSSAVNSFKDGAFCKNPFDVPRNEILRQLKYLPVRVALAMDSRTKAGGTLGKLAAKLLAKEEEEARHTQPIEKMGDFSDALWKHQLRNPFADEQDRTKQQKFLFGNPYKQDSDEAWMEGSGGPQSRGRKRRRRSESPSNSGSTTTTSSSSSSGAGETSSDAGTEVNSPSKRINNDDKLIDSKQQKDSSLLSPGIIVDVVDQASWKAPVADDIDNNPSPVTQRIPSENSQASQASSGNDEAGKKKLKRGSEFVLAALRALRHAKPNGTQKLWELVSAPEIPVDRARLLEQLIQEAHCYKKTVVATELADYRNKFLAGHPQAA